MQQAQKIKYDKFAVLVHSGMKPTEAAITCGYSEKSAVNQGSRLMKDDYVKLQIAALAADLSGKLQEVAVERLMSADEVLDRLANIARSEDVADQNKIAALRLLGLNHKLFTERVEQTTTTVEEGVKARTDARLELLRQDTSMTTLH